ncbi:hypothetical protein SRAA_2094 [Serpentinimonas raichei]|jgi:hypothetical protein|uniref:Uncharacterized protein n=1 Tax=Serpentinimonas raichei TaxID=1458425 RepID=A0A060NQZ8_9BURK|nr:hypothetical protein [Serpentinimonas raichei]BAO81948.1 hypothetical protein SRAA_2094 [Serpentinimonas raichei]
MSPPPPLLPDEERGPTPSAEQQVQRDLALSDSGVARVTEDLIDILILRGVIQFTDFPPAAQAKLLSRRQTRATLSRRLRLLDEQDDTL